MHRELYDLWTVGETVIVRLALQGTHTGPLETPLGTIPPTGKGMDAPAPTSLSWRTARSENSTASRRDQ
jgi:hypothetical protein